MSKQTGHLLSARCILCPLTAFLNPDSLDCARDVQFTALRRPTVVDAREMDQSTGRVFAGLKSRLVNGGRGRSAG